MEFSWLPSDPEWGNELDALAKEGSAINWQGMVRLASQNINFVQTSKLDRLAQRLAKSGIPASADLISVRLALLGSSTQRHLIPGIRIAGLRHGYWVEVYECDYGQYLQELTNANSSLFSFSPQVVCFTFDAEHLFAVGNGDPSATLAHLQGLWRLAKEAFSCAVIQQTALPVFPDLLGSNEHRFPDSPQACIATLNYMLRSAADIAGVDLLAVDKYAARDGIQFWYQAAIWNHSKQEIHPAVSHKYGEYVIRIIGAQLGRSRKCLVLDLDNTLWGGIIGDDGLQGIMLGSGSLTGEAYLMFQRYLLRLRDRGIVLAVCSKNDEINAYLAFDSHPEMLLKRSHISCFVANWEDKPSNLRVIAQSLNLSLDALVFVDDNPFERDLVRKELPMVAVPEMPSDAALHTQVLADAGYFEAVRVTAEDRQRGTHYQRNAEREALKTSVTDMSSYLQGLHMEMEVRSFDEANLARIVQLINKTNQFNLTTKRYTEPEIRSLMGDPSVLSWQIRLRDRFGDNGTIAVIFGRMDERKDLVIDSWLMSCRVLGRQVEDACMNLISAEASAMGAERVIGTYHPTAKNAMVCDHYKKFGFDLAASDSPGSTRWVMRLADYAVRDTFISVTGVTAHA